MQYLTVEQYPEATEVRTDYAYLIGWVVKDTDAAGDENYYPLPYAGVASYDDPHGTSYTSLNVDWAMEHTMNYTAEPDVFGRHCNDAPKGHETFDQAVIGLLDILVSDNRTLPGETDTDPSPFASGNAPRVDPAAYPPSGAPDEKEQQRRDRQLEGYKEWYAENRPQTTEN